MRVGRVREGHLFYLKPVIHINAQGRENVSFEQMGTIHLPFSLTNLYKQKEKQKKRQSESQNSEKRTIFPSFFLPISLTTNVHEMNICCIRLIVVYQSLKTVISTAYVFVCIYIISVMDWQQKYQKGNKTFRWRWRRMKEGLEQRESGQNYYLCPLPTYTLFLAAF